MSRLCCKPSERDDDRTHSVRYSQEYYEDGEVKWSDGGAEVACSHNDAVDMAAAMVARFDNSMKPRGSNGTWIGSEIAEGDGERVTVWVSRGQGEEEYDAARSAP
jgi:hypothetical protein